MELNPDKRCNLQRMMMFELRVCHYFVSSYTTYYGSIFVFLPCEGKNFGLYKYVRIQLKGKFNKNTTNKKKTIANNLPTPKLEKSANETQFRCARGPAHPTNTKSYDNMTYQLKRMNQQNKTYQKRSHL